MLESIFKRLDELFAVLQFCSEMQNNGRIYVFKPEERICINQERGALYSQISRANDENFPSEVRFYQIPPSIEAKVKLTLNKIKI